MSRILRVAVIQMAMGQDANENIGHAGALVAEAAAAGAQLALLPELFAHRYFPALSAKDDPAAAAELRARAREPERCPEVQAMALLARTHGLILPVSYYEAEGEHRYNSLIVFGPEGQTLGHYRKSHIPSGEGYEERDYFDPGDSGFCVIDCAHGRIGVGICWDQWFPEQARALSLMGAEVLLYPSAIGSEPGRPELDTAGPWRRVMQGHAVANTLPVAASNRVGDEQGQRFYGTSFVCDGYGEVMAELDREQQGVALVELDLERWARERHFMGLHRDRRPGLYGQLTKD
ncbi:MAG: N-carbamoylputrescine amidase [Myxococcales bacterium]|nr:N-carbamoylputrescine amidase [Myxococcales bacterium]